MSKSFKTYEEAYSLYSDILSGREKDKTNPSIFYVPDYMKPYLVKWLPKK